MQAIIKSLKPFIIENKKRYIIALVGLMIENLMILIPPYLLGLTIDGIYKGTLTRTSLYQVTGIFLVVIIASYIISVIWGYQLFGGSRLLAKKLRTQLMDHFLSMRSFYYEKFTTGDLMARATNDLDAISEMAGFGVMILLDSTVYLGAIIGMMFISVSWQLTLASLIPIPFLGYVLKKLGDKLNIRYKASQDAFSSINDDVLEGVEGIRVTRAYVQEERLQTKFETQTEDVLQKNIAVSKLNSTFQPLITVLLGFSYVIAFGYGAVLVANGDLTLGELISFHVYLGMIVWPVQSIGELMNMGQQGSASLERVMEVLNTNDEMEEDGVEEISSNGSIQFSDFTFKYPTSDEVNLDHLSLNIQPGMTVGVVGKTGSGKTTLIRQLLRQYPLGIGQLQIDEDSILVIDNKDLNAFIGYVPQDNILFSRSIRDNIKFGNQYATEEEVMDAVELAHFTKDLQRMPEGLDTMIGEKGVAISGGQKQRISIARAMLKNPEILILDDTLSAVDADTEKNIIENIQQNRDGKTTFITTHRLSAIHHADWIIVLDNGKIVEEGTHATLLENKEGWYRAQYVRQQLNEEGPNE